MIENRVLITLRSIDERGEFHVQLVWSAMLLVSLCHQETPEAANVAIAARIAVFDRNKALPHDRAR